MGRVPILVILLLLASGLVAYVALAPVNGSVVSTFNFGHKVSSIVADPAKGEVFIAANPGYAKSFVTVVSDSDYHMIANVSVGIFPNAMVYDPGKGEVFVANEDDDTVSVISDSSNTVVATVAVGVAPFGLAYDSGKGEVFVADYGNTGSEDPQSGVSVISDKTNTVVANITVGESPSGMAYDPSKGEVFVADSDSHDVSVISDETNAVVANVPFSGPSPTDNLGVEPNFLAYDSAEGEVLVSELYSNQVAVVSDSTNAIVANVTIPGEGQIEYDSGRSEAFVATTGAVYVLSESNDWVASGIGVKGDFLGMAYDSAVGEVFAAPIQGFTITVLGDASNPLPASYLLLAAVPVVVLVLALAVTVRARRERSVQQR